ncbi:cupin domain-containing protein [Natrialbaceae archaeon AArc-T1-2]|uniref:cupin domain-containing protein n=1 Tax=Natrialbaceae archaeon AArc-T1-2 TaxID=3053904 RepID=UPI00255AA9DF|nr:cupin domain-containing protein [Natrialbaceae archaeon AArc-T1-2]WIV68448.1 cupin domain-containing protein [Natrialbaceae archaeon AArc-T1-2]
MAEPLIRDGEAIEYEPVDAADGLEKAVLIGEDHGAPNFAMRRFTLEAGSEVPKHTNELEHEQYVLDGEYTVGIEDEEREVSAGDSLFVPAGTVHWYRNDGDDDAAFICVVPHGDDEIAVLE